ncbi:MAG: DUF1707 domain-containing protein [Propionibacteriaceae bacterium]|nr:DUF1707 domain-containing protein [Propionibacteriaceae bacterium]
MNTPHDEASRELHLRVGTAQRERALEVIRNAAADERITFDELEGRVPRALAAVTRADLVSVLDDLAPAAEVDAILGLDTPIGEGPGYTWDDPLILEGTGWKQLIIAGEWAVPPFLEVHSSIGGVLLDFTLATARAKVIDLVLVVNDWGTTTIVVPEGWGVDTQATQVEVSYIETRGVRTRPQADKPRIMVRGRTSGQVKVKLSDDKDARKAQRFIDKGRPGMPELPRA